MAYFRRSGRMRVVGMVDSRIVTYKLRPFYRWICKLFTLLVSTSGLLDYRDKFLFCV